MIVVLYLEVYTKRNGLLARDMSLCSSSY